jgi:hypothetical protein
MAAWFRLPRGSLVRVAAAVTSVLLLTTLWTGVEVWWTYLTSIVPTLGRAWLPGAGDQLSTISLHGVAYLIWPQNPLPGAIDQGLRFVSFAGLIVLIGLMYWKRQAIEADSRAAVAAVATMIVWPLIAGPLFWGHYGYYYFGLTGWLLTECRRPGGIRGVWPAVTLFFLWGPWGRLPLFSSSQTLAQFVPLIIALLILLLSIAILISAQSPANAHAEPRDEPFTT